VNAFRNTSLWEIWEFLSDNPRLGDIAEIHRGIEWNSPLRKNLRILVSSVPGMGFQKGLDKAHGKLECYYAHGFVYLNVEKKFSRTSAHSLPWERTKIIANSRRLSRGPWRIAGFLDEKGLVYYKNLLGIWPKKGIDIFSLSALINNPLLNAFLYCEEYGRDNTVRTLSNVPIPITELNEKNRFSSLVRKYVTIRDSLNKVSPGSRENLTNECYKIIVQIDSLILKAYDLSPRLELKLLDFFKGYPRPVPFPFPDYFPVDFKPCIPLHQYLEMEMKQVSAGELLKRIEPIDSEVIHEFVLDLEERQA
jgi:hypothetical protein